MQGLPSFVRMSAFTCVPFLPVPRLPLGRLAVQGEPLFFKGTRKECFVRLSFFFSFKGCAFISLSLSVCFLCSQKGLQQLGKDASLNGECWTSFWRIRAAERPKKVPAPTKRNQETQANIIYTQAVSNTPVDQREIIQLNLQ